MADSQSEFRLSRLGGRFAAGSGIEDLMDDLGRALVSGDGTTAMLGGGNPAPIEAGKKLWRTRMRQLLDGDGDSFDRMLGFYDPHQGNFRFRTAIADLFNREYGWGITPENVAVTNGGQTAFFFLFNILGGDGGEVIFPLSPEYIGYSAQGLSEGLLRSFPGRIEIEDEVFFRYHIDFAALPDGDSVRAACVSRPTNPTGNVLSPAELKRLHDYCRRRKALLIIDNAYGTPFPNMIFRDEQPYWGKEIVLTYSLSKLGLPGTRTGIVIGPPSICRAVSSMTAVVGLANGSIGQALTLPLIEDGSILKFCREEIRPYYEARAKRAVEILRDAFDGLAFRIHRPDGALFLWLWFPGLGLHSAELYRLFKEAGVLVVPGHFFFHNLSEPWEHSHDCVRLT